jgi:hypothetical protein
LRFLERIRGTIGQHWVAGMPWADIAAALLKIARFLTLYITRARRDRSVQSNMIGIGP